MDRTVSMISNPEFINLEPVDISPFISKCEIKVLYLGQNRNLSSISKEVATDMAKSLRGAPIVGYYNPERDDFRDHGECITIEDGEIKISSNTKPYGFVSLDSSVWFQKFVEADESGNEVEREYLMTTGYLWTEQFEEAKRVIQEGRPQSMELDEKTIDGHWTKDFNSGIEFFIIDDALFSKLCILGEDVEPCFEGAKITSFSNCSQFKTSLFTLMQEYKTILEGGSQKMEKNIQEEMDNSVQENLEENHNLIEGEENSEIATEEAIVENIEEPVPEVVEEEPVPEIDYSAIQTELENLKAEYALIKEERDSLLAFKNEIIEARKDELIDKFSMLSDEDKAEVVVNKTNYSLEEIESKLSVICFRKKVSFSEPEANEVEEHVEELPAIQFTHVNNTADAPGWLSAVEHTILNKN